MFTHQRIAAACLGFAVTAFVTFMGLTPPEFTGARYSFAAALILFVIVYVIWVVSAHHRVKAQLFYAPFIAFILAFGIVKVYPWIDYREKTYPRVPIYAGILIPLKLIDGGSVANDVKIRIGNSTVFFNTAAVF